MPGAGRPFTKGHDPRRHPGGRNPDGSTNSQADLMEALRQKMPAEYLAAKVDELVRDGDPKATLYMIDRVLGRPAQAIQISGDAERPLHGLLGVVSRDMMPLDAPVPAALPAPTEVEGELVEEEEPDDTGGP